MDPNTAIDRILSSPRPASVFREMRGVEGFATAYFQRVLAAFGADPAVAQGLAGHWRLLLVHGDNPALAYRVKGVADRAAGRWLQSAKSFIRAGESAKRRVDRLSFQVGAVDGLARAGRVDEAVGLGRRLYRGLMRLGERGLSARVALNVGNALLWADRYREAARWLRLAQKDLSEHPPERVFAELGLSTAELFGGSPREAGELAASAAAAAEQLGLEHTVHLARLNQAQADLIQGRADQALQVLLEIRPHLAGAPAEHARTAEFLGDAYLRLNLYPEAADSYQEALRLPLPPLNHGASQLGLAQALILDGRPDAAIEFLRKARRTFTRASNDPWAAAAETWLARAQGGRRGVVQAAAAAEKARAAGSHWHEAEALLTLAELSAAPPQAAVNRASLLIRKRGFQSMRWRALAQRTRTEGTLASHRRTFDAIIEDRLLTRSFVSRSAYMRDKQEHLVAYLGVLLDRPTPARVREALRAVARSRSAALVDEIAHRAGHKLTDAQLSEIDVLRAELSAIESERADGGGWRRGSSLSRIAALQRRWIQATHRLIGDAAYYEANPATVVLARAREDLFALHQGRAVRLRLDGTTLQKLLKWLRFELLAPMADRSAEPSPAIAIIEQLGCALASGWTGEHADFISVCPADQLWGVPWTTCLSMVWGSTEAVMAIHPNFTRVSDAKLDASSKAMLWIDRAKDLPFAEAEAKAFLSQFPRAVVCESAEEARRSLAGRIDVLHVICHARHNAGNPMFSSLQFQDGSIFAAEIARSELSARIVTLSACETANVNVSVRDEPDGLARAFLARGAESVIGSLWPLDDEAAARMFSSLYEEMTSGATLLEGLRTARAKVRAWNPHPYFWGSTVLFGGYA